MFSTLTISALGNLSIGAFYQYIAPKFLVLSKSCLNKQLSAFAISSFAQLFFQYKDKSTSEEPVFSDDFFDNLIRYSLPYLLIGGSNCCLNEVSLKVNIISTILLGTAQLKACQYSAAIAEDIEYRKSFVFNGNAWDIHLGAVDPEPEKPRNLEAVLNSDCPFNKGKKVKETHRLVLIPKTLKGEPFNLLTLNEAIKNPKKGYKTKISAIIKKEDIKNVSLENISKYTESDHQAPYWILVTKELVSDDNMNTMNTLYRKTTPIEAITTTLTQYVRLKKEICGREIKNFQGDGLESFIDCESEQLKSLIQQIEAEVEPARQALQVEIDELKAQLQKVERELEEALQPEPVIDQHAQEVINQNTFWKSYLSGSWENVIDQSVPVAAPVIRNTTVFTQNTRTRPEEMTDIFKIKERIKRAEKEIDRKCVISVKVGAFSRKKVTTGHRRHCLEGPQLFRDGLSIDVSLPLPLSSRCESGMHTSVSCNITSWNKCLAVRIFED